MHLLDIHTYIYIYIDYIHTNIYIYIYIYIITYSWKKLGVSALNLGHGLGFKSRAMWWLAVSVTVGGPGLNT